MATVDGVEHNPHALAIWQRVKQKLEGLDNEGTEETIAQQVERTIVDARDIDHLSTLYEGWTPWV